MQTFSVSQRGLYINSDGEENSNMTDATGSNANGNRPEDKPKKSPTPTIWPTQWSYPPRPGNGLHVFIDGQAAYGEIGAAFQRAKKLIYATISYCDQDFSLVPPAGESIVRVLKSCASNGIDVRVVIWQPASKTPDTLRDPINIPGVNSGSGYIQARWDQPKGYKGRYCSPNNHFDPFPVEFPAYLGCHHQKTYFMDDGSDGYVAFVGGINPVQAYWDTPAHDCLDKRRVEKCCTDILKGLEEAPPLHDLFYKVTGPVVGDVIANFVERYNGATIPYHAMTSDAIAPVGLGVIPQVQDGIELQVLRTIAPDTYGGAKAGDRGIREFYFNALQAAGENSLVYIENQYFYDHGIISEIHAAAERGAKIIVLLTSKPDENSPQGKVEKILETLGRYRAALPLVRGHANVALLTLGITRPDPRAPGKSILSEIYIHSKNMAVIDPAFAAMTGGSANIAFTSMWFHSEMNVAFTDLGKIRSWVAQLWAEHLQIPVEQAAALIDKPQDALKFFRDQAVQNEAAVASGTVPPGRVFEWGTSFPARKLEGIDLNSVILAKGAGAGV
jgi:phosphatidylserine/phosphatidylglycerophosphate/cardiolipin synthase-like enzyme